MHEGGKVNCQPVRGWGCLAFVQISEELLDVADDISAPFSSHFARIDFFVVPTLFSFLMTPAGKQRPKNLVSQRSHEHSAAIAYATSQEPFYNIISVKEVNKIKYNGR